MFKLRIGWTDTSYWDDGNRGTSVTLEFTSLEEVNNFVIKHLQQPYAFPGQEGKVERCLELDRLHLTEVTTQIHDIYSLPALKVHGIEKFREDLRSIAKWGGDLKALEKRSCEVIKWSRSDFLREWEAAVKEVAGGRA